MRIACLVTVCAFLLSSVSVAEANLVNGAKRGRSDGRQMQSRLSTADGSSNSTVGYQEVFQSQRRIRTTTHASVAKRLRRPATTQTSSNQTIQMQQNKRDRSRRHLKRNKSRQGRIGRSFDLVENQIEEFPVLPTKYMKDGAIYIEPIARVVTHKGILDSFVDLVKKVFEPSEHKLGPLVGPIKFPGVGDKVYVRLLESPEHGPNHVTLRLITREPVPLIAPEILSTTVIKGDTFNGIKGISFQDLKGGESLHGIEGDVFHGELYHGINGDAFDGIKGESFGVIKGGESLRAVLPTATIVEHVEASGTKHEHQQVLPTPVSSDASIFDAANRHRRLVPHSTKSPHKDQAGQESKNMVRGAGREQQGGEKPKSSERFKGSKEVTGGDGKQETIITGTRGYSWGNMIDAPIRPTMSAQTTSRQRYPTYVTQVKGHMSPTREAFQLEEGMQTHTRYAPQSHGIHMGSGSKNNGNGHSLGTGNVVTEPTYSNNYGNLGSGVRYPTAQEESNSNLPENSFQPSPMIQYYPDYRDHYYADSYRPEVYNNSRVPKHTEPHKPFESFVVRSTINPTILPVRASSVPSTVESKVNYQDKSALRVIQAPNLRVPTTQATPTNYRRTTPSYYEHQKKKAEELLQIEAAMGELRKLEAPVEWQPVSMMNTWANTYMLSTTTEMSTQRSAINKNIGVGVGVGGRVELPNSSNLDNYREKVEESKQSGWSPFVDLPAFARHGGSGENRESMSFEPTSLRKKKARMLANENVGFVSEPLLPIKGPIKVVKVIKKPYYPENVTTPRSVATVKPQVKTTSRPKVKPTPEPTAKPTVKPAIMSAVNSAAVPVVSLAAIPMQIYPPLPVAQPVAMPPPKQEAIPQHKSAMPSPQQQPLPAAKPAPMPVPKNVAKPTAKAAFQPVIKPTMRSHPKPLTTPATFQSTTRRPTRPAPTQKLAPTPKYGTAARSATTTTRPTKMTKIPSTSNGAKSLIHKLFKSTTPRTGLRFPKLKLTTAPSAKAA